jgi:hypothetical protein
MELRVQRSKEGMWLFRDFYDGEGNWQDRAFVKEVTLGINDIEWDECTNAEKKRWEEEHKQEEQE